MPKRTNTPRWTYSYLEQWWDETPLPNINTRWVKITVLSLNMQGSGFDEVEFYTGQSKWYWLFYLYHVNVPVQHMQAI